MHTETVMKQQSLQRYKQEVTKFNRNMIKKLRKKGEYNQGYVWMLNFQ